MNLAYEKIDFKNNDGISRQATFENYKGVRSVDKCIFIAYDNLESEVVLHNIDKSELERIVEILPRLLKELKE